MRARKRQPRSQRGYLGECGSDISTHGDSLLDKKGATVRDSGLEKKLARFPPLCPHLRDLASLGSGTDLSRCRIQPCGQINKRPATGAGAPAPATNSLGGRLLLVEHFNRRHGFAFEVLQAGAAPVDTWVILSARPIFSTAAAESPPPITVMAPRLVAAAMALATARVPAA